VCKGGTIYSGDSDSNDGSKIEGSIENTLQDGWGSEQREEESEKRGQKRFFTKPSGSFIEDWRNFPTQSPIRSRNDGLPGGLDGITFSKWRNESIKAGGNAIVPQVALQIFKAIKEFNQQHHETANT